MQSLIQELQRRRVPRVLGIYMAAAFALSQAVQLIADALHLPHWVLTASVILGLAGFPVVALLAWVFDFGRDGVVRTPEAPPSIFRWTFMHVAVAGVVFVALMVGGFFALRPREDNAGPVGVLPLQNRSGDAALESLGEVAADWITESLMNAGFAEVVDLQTTMRAEMLGSSTAAVPNAKTLVSGSYYRAGEQLVFNVKITRADGTVIRALQPIYGPAADPTVGVNSLRDRVVTALAMTWDKSVGQFEAHTAAAPSYPAYQAYVEGLSVYLGKNAASAASHFQRAVSLDTAFLRARIWAAFSTAPWDAAEAHGQLTQLKSRINELSRYDRHHLLFFDAFLSSDYERAYEEARAMLKAAPASDNAMRENALMALRTGRVNEAISLLEELEERSGISAQWPEFFFVLSDAYQAKGDYAKAIRIAQSLRSLSAEDTWALIGTSEARRGNTRVAEAVADTLLSQHTETGAWGAALIAIALNAAGARETALGLWKRTARSANPLGRAASYYWIGDLDAAATILGADTSTSIGERTALRGAIAARRNHHAAALAILDTLANGHLPGRGLQRARIFAILGQKDSAMSSLRGQWYHERFTSEDPDLLALRGYPPFDRMIRPR